MTILFHKQFCIKNSIRAFLPNVGFIFLSDYVFVLKVVFQFDIWWSPIVALCPLEWHWFVPVSKTWNASRDAETLSIFEFNVHSEFEQAVMGLVFLDWSRLIRNCYFLIRLNLRFISHFWLTMLRRCSWNFCKIKKRRLRNFNLSLRSILICLFWWILPQGIYVRQWHLFDLWREIQNWFAHIAPLNSGMNTLDLIFVQLFKIRRVYIWCSYLSIRSS